MTPSSTGPGRGMGRVVSPVAVRVIRPLMLFGQRVERETLLEVEPNVADMLVSSGRAELVCVADSAVLCAARRAAAVKALRYLGRRVVAPADPRWQPVR